MYDVSIHFNRICIWPPHSHTDRLIAAVYTFVRWQHTGVIPKCGSRAPHTNMLRQHVYSVAIYGTPSAQPLN